MTTCLSGLMHETLTECVAGDIRKFTILSYTGPRLPAPSSTRTLECDSTMVRSRQTPTHVGYVWSFERLD